MNDLESKIGHTPLKRLEKIEKAFCLKAKLYAKLEHYNAGGSIKDRVAQAIITDAEQSGKLKKGGTVIEATSGNTGIGLALVCRARGYQCLIVMPDSMSVERRKLLCSYGAELVLTDGKKGMQGAVEKAEEILRQTENSVIAGQFANPVCAQVHYQTTGVEIAEQLIEKADIFTAAVGTGGTLTGVGRYLKEKYGSKVVAIEPKKSPLLSQGKAGAHGIQGIGANFIPEILDRGVYSEVLLVADEEAIAMAKQIKQTENEFVGISSGANLCGAIELAKRAENAGTNIITVFPDSGDRYLSVFEN